MKALVVYESMFGNTAQVAEAVADGLRQTMDVTVADVADWPDAGGGWALLIVGAPTHAFGLSRPTTRGDAAHRVGFSGHAEVGVREWIDEEARHSAGLRFAAFDTRIQRPRLPGSAARAIDRRLRHLSLVPVAPPESFWVDEVAGPLRPGELTRARAWAAGVAAAAKHALARQG